MRVLRDVDDTERAGGVTTRGKMESGLVEVKWNTSSPFKLRQ
jgi:hypothetical protein